MIAPPALTVPVAKSIKQEVEKSSLEEAKMEESSVYLAETGDNEKMNGEKEIPTWQMVRLDRQVPDGYI